jgi:hypothetical protein
MAGLDAQDLLVALLGLGETAGLVMLDRGDEQRLERRRAVRRLRARLAGGPALLAAHAAPGRAVEMSRRCMRGALAAFAQARA